MNNTYTVGRSASADIRIPKQHDTVGKLHCEVEDLGEGWTTVTDLKSTNGTFLHVAGNWEELDAPRTVSIDAEIMLGSYVTTPRRLLADSATAPMKLKSGSIKEHPAPKPPPKPAARPLRPPAGKQPVSKTTAGQEPSLLLPPVPAKRPPGMRRNEFGEIVAE